MRQTILFSALAAAQAFQQPVIFVAGVPVTARKQEVYEYDAEMTLFAIESAQYASDHIILRPIKIELECQVGNWYPQMPGYALNLFEQIWNSRNLLTLITQHKQIPNMALKGYRAENEAPMWGKLDFHLTFQQMPLVISTTSNYAPSQTAAGPNTGGADVSKSVNPATNSGQTTPQQPTTQQEQDFDLPAGVMQT